MHNRFKVISISHKTAPVEVREQLALNPQETMQILERIKELFSLRDVLVLSTCNRSEIYYSSDEDLSDELVKILTLQKNLGRTKALNGYFNNISDHQDAVEHLLRVSCGLESQIVGDMQITNQVKTAYQMSADADMSGPFMHRLLHSAFFTNKKIVQETAFRDGAASVSYAALELISELTVNLEAPTLLIIGLGNIGSDLCMNVSDHKNFQNFQVLLANRTADKASTLAEMCNFKAVPFDSIDSHIQAADVIVSAVSSDKLLVHQDNLSALPMSNYKYFIDLGVPRSVDTGIEDINGVLLYNIDDIKSRADRALKRRLSSIPKVESLVTETMENFEDWSKDMSVNPTINKLKNALEQIRKEEIARYLKDASDDESVVAEKLTKSIMQKVIKLPVLQLKAACRRGEAETLIDVLNDLFNLEKEGVSPEKK